MEVGGDGVLMCGGGCGSMLVVVEEREMNSKEVVVGLVELIGDWSIGSGDEELLWELVDGEMEEWKEVEWELVKDGLVEEYGDEWWSEWEVEELRVWNEVGMKVWGEKFVDVIRL